MLNWIRKITGGNMMFENLDAETFNREMSSRKDVVILDVRTPGEFNSGKLPGAKNLNFNAPDFKEKLENLDRSKRYFVYCRSGARSFNACTIMTNTGFENVANLQGGIMRWRGKVVR